MRFILFFTIFLIKFHHSLTFFEETLKKLSELASNPPMKGFLFYRRPRFTRNNLETIEKVKKKYCEIQEQKE